MDGEPCHSAVIEKDILALKTFVALLYLGQIIEMCNALGTCQGIHARGISLTAAPPYILSRSSTIRVLP